MQVWKKMVEVSKQKPQPMPTHFILFIALLVNGVSCTNDTQNCKREAAKNITVKPGEDIRGISLPEGFRHVKEGDSVYSDWLLDLKFKKNRSVYLYDGRLKSNQDVQFGVLDIDIGRSDLVQCADAAIKLKADFLFEKSRYSEINFIATSGDKLSFVSWLNGTRWKEQGSKLMSYTITRNMNNIKNEYNAFMQFVFSYCGTYSLAKQLKPVNELSSIQPGDIFIQGGFPGHAITVMAVAKNGNGKKIFLLSQGYMPAQDIHILKNYADPQLSPWYDMSNIDPLHTPQWKFESGSLKRW